MILAGITETIRYFSSFPEGPMGVLRGVPPGVPHLMCRPNAVITQGVTEGS